MKRPTTQQQQQKHNNTKTILRGCAAARMAAQPKESVSKAILVIKNLTEKHWTKFE